MHMYMSMYMSMYNRRRQTCTAMDAWLLREQISKTRQHEEFNGERLLKLESVHFWIIADTGLGKTVTFEGAVSIPRAW